MNTLPNDYQNFIALSRYARWLPDKNRRETWQETVARYFDFMEEHLKENCDHELLPKTRKILEDAGRHVYLKTCYVDDRRYIWLFVTKTQICCIAMTQVYY